MSFFTKVIQRLRRKPERKEEEVGAKTGTRIMSYESPWVRFINRKRLWEDLHDMDTEEPIIARGLDNIAGLVTASADDSIIGFELEGGKKELNALMPLVEASQLREQAFDHVRSMVLYGDVFFELIADDEGLISRIKQFPFSYEIEVNWDKFGNLCQGNPERALLGFTDDLPAYVQRDEIGRVIAAFFPYQIVQMSFGFKGGLQYAEPLLACATPIWKRLRAKEDGLAVARLTRAYTEKIHHVPVPIGSTKNEVEQKLREYRDNMTTDYLVSYDANQTQFEITNRAVPPSIDSDHYLPRFYTPDGKSVVDGSIENLKADNPHLTELQDIYLDIRRLICALGIPSQYLNLDVGAKAFVDKSSEESRDSFAFLVLRVTHAYRMALKQIFDLQLLLSGINPLKADYTIRIPLSLPPRATQTVARVDNLRSHTAMMWAKLGVPQEIIGKRLLGLTATELKKWLDSTGGELSLEGLNKWIEHAKEQLVPRDEELY